MKSRKHYEKLFDPYPDVVTLPEFCNMLGGIGRQHSPKTYTANKVKHFYIRCTYFIPKESVIDYVMSYDYLEYSKKLKSEDLSEEPFVKANGSCFYSITRFFQSLRNRVFSYDNCNTLFFCKTILASSLNLSISSTAMKICFDS